jgi:glycosyltransferase involved in cell wall biosynthesis
LYVIAIGAGVARIGLELKYGCAVNSHRPALVVDVIVPARDAAATIGDVLARLPHRRLRTVMVVDNGSTDATSQIARDAGVVVLRQSRGGYGAACRYGMAHLAQLPQPPDVVAFVPGDGRSDAAALPALLRRIDEDGAELVIGVQAAARSTSLGDRAVAGLIGAVYRQPVRGVGIGAAMRAIRYPALVALGMSDRGGGWDVEMLVRALKLGLIVVETPIEAPGARRGRGLGDRAAAQGRSLFHILRHATLR